MSTAAEAQAAAHHVSAPGDVQIRLELTDAPPNPAHRSWHSEAVLRRYEAAAAAFDADAMLQAPAVRERLGMLQRIPLTTADILDVGCGWGAWGRLLAGGPQPLPRWRYQGVEVTPEIVDLCRRLNPAASFAVGTAEDIPCQDRSHDIVLSSGVLSYVPDWRMCLREAARVARGYLALLRTPVIKHHPTTCCLQTVRTADHEEVYHLWLFARDELHEELDRAGLSVLHWDYTNEVHRVHGLGERVVFLNYVLTVDSPRR
jgi:ubiquinone/menaquinone biosynthesis C-methylase UbiE